MFHDSQNLQLLEKYISAIEIDKCTIWTVKTPFPAPFRPHEFCFRSSTLNNKWKCSRISKMTVDDRILR